MAFRSNERSLHHALIFSAGAVAMLGALLAVARVSGGEREALPAPEAEERARAYAASAESYCGEMLAGDDARRASCVREQVSAAHEVHRLALALGGDDPRRRILDSCGRALGEDTHLRLECYREQLGALQLNAGWVTRRSDVVRR